MRALERSDPRKWRAMQRRLGVDLRPEVGDHARITPLNIYASHWNNPRPERSLGRYKQKCGESFHDAPYEVELLHKNGAEAWLVRCLEHEVEEVVIFHAGLKVEVL